MTARRKVSILTFGVSAALSLPAQAQTEYRNLEAGRPIRMADATPTERYALDLDLTTLRLERLSLGRYRLQYEPRIAYGIMPRTEVSVRVPSFYRERSISPRGGIAGVGIGAEYQLVMEGLHAPAIALAGEAFIPTGPNALRESYSVKGLLTRSFPLLRLHLNASYGSFPVREITGGGGVLLPPVIDGPCNFEIPETGMPMRAFCGAGEMEQLSNLATVIVTKYRWVAGAGIDKTFALKSLLLAADVFVEKYEKVGRPSDWTAEGGARKQLTHYMVVDAAIGRRFTGISPSWFATAGTTFTMPFGI